MYTEAIKDFTGKILYYLEHKDNGDIVRKSFSGKIEETYNPKSNTTKNFSGKILAQGNAIGGTSIQNTPTPQRREDIKDFGGKILYTIEHKPNGDLIKRSFSGKIEGTYNARSNVTQDFSGKILAQGNILGGTSQKYQAKPDSNNTYKPTHYNYFPDGPPAKYAASGQLWVTILTIIGLAPIAAMLHSLFSVKHEIKEFYGDKAIYDKNSNAFTKKTLVKITPDPAQVKMRKQFKVMLIVFISIAVVAIVIRIIQR